MGYLLGDIYIGDYPITQAFGANPEIYSAKYGIKAHNGIDWACPTMTLVLSAADGFVSETGFDAGGYGNYIKVVHTGYLTLYGHLNDIQVKQGDKVVCGQLIGHSNNTGNSTGPHLHFGVAPCDGQGIKTEPDNGYSGYIDPMSSACTWNVKNLKEPVTPNPAQKPPVEVNPDDYSRIVTQGSNFIVIASYLVKAGANAFLSSIGKGQLDGTNAANDPDGGTKAVDYIMSLYQQIDDLKNTVTILTNQLSEAKKTQPLDNPQTQPVQSQNDNQPVVTTTQSATQGFFSAIAQAVKDFVFVKGSV